MIANIYAANLAEHVGPSPELALSYSMMSVTCGHIPLHSLARAYSRWAQEIAQSLNDLATLAFVSAGTGYYYLGIGQWAEAKRALGQGVEIRGYLGSQRYWEESWGLLAVVAYHQGQFAQSAQMFADVFASAHRRDDPQPQLWGLLGQVENRLRLGGPDLDKVTSLLESAQRILSENPYNAEKIRTYGVLAWTHLRRNEPQLARQAAQTAEQYIAQTSFIVHYSFEGYAGPAEVYLTLWEASGNQPSVQKTLAKSARQACKVLRNFARIFPIGQPRYRLYQGLYEWLSGKPRQAHSAWQKSLAHAEQLAMPYEQGLAQYEIGRHLPLDDPARQDHLSQARDIFTKLEANYDLRRTQQELMVGGL
jgi:hypothetical protein